MKMIVTPILASGAAFLKFVSVAAGVTMGVQIVSDVVTSDFYERWKEKRGRRVKTVKSFTLDDVHTCVMGRTQNGKTYGTIRSLLHVKEGVFFYNTNHTTCPAGWTKATNKNTLPQIVGLLKKGKKINYMPSGDLEQMSKELALITEHFFKCTPFNIRYAIDETHLFSSTKDKSGLNAMVRVVTTGLSKGMKGVWITQRPANMNNNLLTQSDVHVMFKLGDADLNYLKNFGLPTETIYKTINNQKYVFCEYDGANVTGGFKIG